MSKRKKGQRKAASRRVPGSHDTTLAWFRHDGHIGGPTFAGVDDQNVFTRCDTKDESIRRLGRDTPSLARQTLPNNVNRLFRLPNDLRGHDDGVPCGDSPDPRPAIHGAVTVNPDMQLS